MAMRRYAAFLRGVTPTNARMPELRRSFEAAGFTEVKTLLTGGNVVFGARPAGEVFTACVPSSRGAVFMTLIEKTFGDEQTTRTWDTIEKVVGDHPAVPAAAAGVRRATRRA